jgi:outer membrane protein OmpA-like peptidoglycan-associated protein
MPERCPYWIGVLLALCAMLPAVGNSAPTRAERREMDRDEALLREWFTALPPDSAVLISRDDAHVTLRLPVAMAFDSDSRVIRSDAMSAVPLAATLKLMKQRRALTAQIIVYTDTIGGASANQTLSDARAKALSTALSSAGVSAQRLQFRGGGAGNALAGNGTPEGRSENRRIEIEFRKGRTVRSGPAADL